MLCGHCSFVGLQADYWAQVSGPVNVHKHTRALEAPITNARRVLFRVD